MLTRVTAALLTAGAVAQMDFYLSPDQLAELTPENAMQNDQIQAWLKAELQATQDAGLAASPEELAADAEAELMSVEDMQAQTLSVGTNERVTIESGGQSRTFYYFVPSSPANDTHYPVLFNWHGLGGNGNSQATGTGSSLRAEEEGWVGIYPNARGILSGHNSGSCCGWVNPFNPSDDVLFARDAFAYLQDELGIPLSTEHVFGAGFSNGGFMAHRAACEMSDLVRAVAPHSGYLSYDCPLCMSFRSCEPEQPVSVLHFHGTWDVVVPYPRFWLHPLGTGVDNNMKEWAGLNGCSDEYEEFDHTSTSMSMRYPSCNNGTSVEFVRIQRFGHSWARASNGHVDATDYLFESFKKLIA